MPLPARIPSYRHHKARGLAVVTLNGIDHYLGPWKSKASLLAYARLIDEWPANGRTVKVDAATDPKSSLTIVELLAKYVDYLKAT